MMLGNDKAGLAANIIRQIGGINSLKSMIEQAQERGGEAVISPYRLHEISTDQLSRAGFLAPHIIPFTDLNDITHEVPRPYVSLHAIASAIGLPVTRGIRLPEL